MNTLATNADAKGGDALAKLRASLEAAMEFTPNRAAALKFSVPQLQSYAEEEASFGRITVDDRGVTAGTVLHILQPARTLLAEWRQTRSSFDTALEPRMADIQAVERLQADIQTLKDRRAAEVAQVEHIWEASRENQDIRRRRDEAEAVFNQARLNNGMRDARMTAYQPVYWIVMLCIGVAEWLINYDTFFLFVGVPAIAAGATLILGVLLAFSAHGHGELFKQWSHRFGQHQTRMNRLGGYRLLALATLGLVIVMTSAGGSRYAAAMRTLSAQPGQNILGDSVAIAVSPLRDVLISLLANLGAWVVGVFFAYFCHDPDPDFMAATRQQFKASRRYYRARHDVEDEVRTIEARFGREMEQMERAATARAASVAVERGMLDQITKQENGIIEAISASTHVNAGNYRNVLAQIALAKRGTVTFVRVLGDGERALTPYEYQSSQLRIDSDFLGSSLVR